MKLAELQSIFWRAARFDPMPAEVDDVFVEREGLSARQRLKIYQDAYWFRQVDALFECFPSLARVAGHERFTRLCCRYLEAYPSRAPELERLGCLLASFLADEGEPGLADLAALEQARLAALIAPPSAVASIRSLDVERFAFASLELVPALVPLALRRGALLRWAEPASFDDPAPCRAAAWRKGFSVHHTELPPDEAEALARAADGAPLSAICEVFLGDEAPEQRAFSALSCWFSRHWISAIRYPEPAPG